MADLHMLSGQVRGLDSDLGRDSIFLGWTPAGNELLVKVNVISNSRIYLINVASGKVEQLPVPWTTYNVALSRNGKRMLYSLTRGLGYGSETWIAYIRMPDSNIPFTVGELWVLDGAGNAPVLLGEWTVPNVTQFKEALTEAPVWSPDGEFLAFSSVSSQYLECGKSQDPI